MHGQKQSRLGMQRGLGDVDEVHWPNPAEAVDIDVGDETEWLQHPAPGDTAAVKERPLQAWMLPEQFPTITRPSRLQAWRNSNDSKDSHSCDSTPSDPMSPKSIASSRRESCIASSRRESFRRKQETQERFSSSFFGRLAVNKRFEAVTTGVVVLNALQMGWDTEYTATHERPENLYEGPIEFILTENFFAIYFAVEIAVRFLGFERWSHCCDAWFLFDSSLALMMVLEAYLVPFVQGGDALAQFSILRLLRLLRITRMAKLMKAMPEILMILRGMKSAATAVMWTAVLLGLVTYTWAIMFTFEYHQGEGRDDDFDAGDIEFFFGSIGKSMLSLLTMGTVLDDVSACTDTLRSTNKMSMLALFLLYILINSFTVMNMLIGVLVNVVSDTVHAERRVMLEETIYGAIVEIFQTIDADNSGCLTKDEFQTIARSKHLTEPFKVLNIEQKHLHMFAETLFEPTEQGEEPVVTFDAMVQMLLEYQAEAELDPCKVKFFKSVVQKMTTNVQARTEKVESMCRQLLKDIPVQQPLILPAQKGAPMSLPDAAALLEKVSREPRHAILSELQRRFSAEKVEAELLKLYNSVVESQGSAQQRDDAATFLMPAAKQAFAGGPSAASLDLPFLPLRPQAAANRRGDMEIVPLSVPSSPGSSPASSPKSRLTRQDRQISRGSRGLTRSTSFGPRQNRDWQRETFLG
eukprot:TRINITY_DN11058_c0_g1_i1.p1 TRINITY_DN11058_c0_g1~~TRINITY_DN11058_c0_g1_i1.p1  ORF type:complete len:694 (-),score=170.67 TRINITY_DN11058_c0_g1_i1:51-2132(-)